MRHVVVAIALASCVFTAHGWPFDSHKRVHITDMTALTFYPDRVTTSRRGSPIPQLQCVGGDARYEYTPQAIQCTQTGFDGKEAQWRCEAQLPNGLELGRTVVSCEGYSGAYDEYILVGSCGLEYELNYAPGVTHKSFQPAKQYESYQTYTGERHYFGMLSGLFHRVYSGFKSVIGRLIVMLLSTLCVYKLWNALHNSWKNQPQYHEVHPTSYTQQTVHTTKYVPSSGYSNNAVPAENWSTGSTGAGAGATGGNSGFWKGAGLAGLAGYALGRSRAAPAAVPTAPVQTVQQTSQYKTGPVFDANGHPIPYTAPIEPVPVVLPEATTTTTHTSVGYGTTKRR